MAESDAVTNARERVRPVIPKLIEMSENVLYGDIWQRQEISPRDRSLVTISALVAMTRPEELTSHIQRGINNGLTLTEVGEAITHLGFYAGWPAAMSAGRCAREAADRLGLLG